MYQLESILNTIIQGNSSEVLKQFPPSILDACVTSPPYFGLRVYNTKPQTWGGKPDCEHEWNEVYKPPQGGKNPEGRPANVGANRDINDTDLRGKGTYSNFCTKCSAWQGSLGLEPLPSLYISHLCDIFSEVMRVLKPTGTLWVNLSDTYMATRSYQVDGTKQTAGSQPMAQPMKNCDMPEKSLLCIPDMFKIEMVRRGYICRNDVVWLKRNAMPSSSSDRFSVDYERIFFFVKSSDTQYYTNEKTLQLTTKQPLGIKGIEGIDWQWIPCPQCQVVGEGEASINGCIDESINQNVNSSDPCPRCNSIEKIQKSLWSGHDYYFEQQFEPYTELPNRWGGTKLKAKQSTIGDSTTWDNNTGQSTYRDRSLRPNDLGRNKRCVWQIPESIHEVVLEESGDKISISQSELKLLLHRRQNRAHGSILDVPTKPNLEAHFATFPDGLIHTPIIAGSPEHVCRKCGMPRQPIFTFERTYRNRATQYQSYRKINGQPNQRFDKSIPIKKCYSDCGCGSGWLKGIVLDPFVGIGTTALKARKEGRNFIGIELNIEYIKIANKLLSQKTIEKWMEKEKEESP